MLLFFNIPYNTAWQQASSNEYDAIITELQFFVSTCILKSLLQLKA